MKTLVIPLLITYVLLNGRTAVGEDNSRQLAYSLQYYKCETYGHKCIDATQCRTVLKLLQGTDADVSRAQFLFCGEENDAQFIDDENEYGYGPVVSALGPPLACCAKEEIIPFPYVDNICNKHITALRDHRCGVTSVFYLNLEMKKVMMEEYRYRLEQINRNGGKPCVRSAMDFRWRGKRCADEDDGKQISVPKEELGDIVFEERMKNRMARLRASRGRTRKRMRQPQQKKKKTRRRQRGTTDLVNDHPRKKRFIGGLSARIGQFPFLAVIYLKTYKKNKIYIGCVGSIIHPKLVLTTKSCMNRGLINEIWSGGYQYKNATKFGVSFQKVNGMEYPLTFEPQRLKFHFATNVFAPQDYKTWKIELAYNKTFLNPFGLSVIKVQVGFHFDDFTQPICLPTSPYKEDWFEGPRVSVGFGFGTGTEEFEGYPRYAYLEKADDCKNLLYKYYGEKFPMRDKDDKQIWECLLPDVGTQPCMLDEGAPLIRMTKDGFMMQTGILMRLPQEACGFVRMPIAYLDLNRFVDWFPKGLNSLFSIPPPPFSRYPAGSLVFDIYDTNLPSNCLSAYERKRYRGEVND